MPIRWNKVAKAGKGAWHTQMATTRKGDGDDDDDDDAIPFLSLSLAVQRFSISISIAAIPSPFPYAVAFPNSPRKTQKCPQVAALVASFFCRHGSLYETCVCVCVCEVLAACCGALFCENDSHSSHAKDKVCTTVGQIRIGSLKSIDKWRTKSV